MILLSADQAPESLCTLSRRPWTLSRRPSRPGLPPLPASEKKNVIAHVCPRIFPPHRQQKAHEQGYAALIT
jgi:hypothetical protein